MENHGSARNRTRGNTVAKDSDNYALVLNLQRWDHTEIQLSLKERLLTLLTGRVKLDDMIGHHSVGWVPVFQNFEDAKEYQLDGGDDAPIQQVKRRLEE